MFTPRNRLTVPKVAWNILHVTFQRRPLAMNVSFHAMKIRSPLNGETPQIIRKPKSCVWMRMSLSADIYRIFCLMDLYDHAILGFLQTLSKSKISHSFVLCCLLINKITCRSVQRYKT